MQLACLKDLGRVEFFTKLAECDRVINDAKHAIGNLDEYMTDKWFDPSILYAPNSHRIMYEPLGVCLIFGSWNYPFGVTLGPLVQAIATGNCAVIKPSEMSPECSSVMQKLVDQYLDPRCFRVI